MSEPDDNKILDDESCSASYGQACVQRGMGLSPGTAIHGRDGHALQSGGDTGKVTDEQAEQYWKAVEEREKERSRE